jgi:hypothetical protein
MYAIRSIARCIPNDENVIFPTLFPMLPQLPPLTEIRATSFRLIGRMTMWLTRRPEYLIPCLDFVIEQGLMPAPGADGK